MILKFGKHKGYPIEEIPDGYLQWLFFLETLDRDIEQAVKAEVAARWPDKIQLLIKPPRLRASRKKNPPEQAAIKTIFRELAKQFHPDRGGSTDAMAALNEFYARLQALK